MHRMTLLEVDEPSHPLMPKSHCRFTTWPGCRSQFPIFLLCQGLGKSIRQPSLLCGDSPTLIAHNSDNLLLCQPRVVVRFWHFSFSTRGLSCIHLAEVSKQRRILGEWDACVAFWQCYGTQASACDRWSMGCAITSFRVPHTIDPLCSRPILCSGSLGSVMSSNAWVEKRPSLLPALLYPPCALHNLFYQSFSIDYLFLLSTSVFFL